jgi:hypothetical protein
MSMSHRRLGRWFLLASGLMAAVFLFRRRPHEEPGPSSAAAHAPPAQLHRPPPVFAAQPAPLPVNPSRDNMEDFLERIAGPGVNPGPGRKYMERYHGRSGRLSHSAAIERSARARSAGKDLTVELWVTPVPVEAGAPLVVHARLENPRPELLSVSRIAVTALDGPEAKVLFTAPMRPDPAAPMEYVATLEAPRSLRSREDSQNEVPVPTTVTAVLEVTGLSAGEPFERRVSTGFTVQKMEASIVDGSVTLDRNGEGVVVRFQIQVRRPGTYFSQAELWTSGAGGRPIAFGRERLVGLGAGTHAVELLFGGEVIKDSGADGPYVIKELSLMQVDTIPPHQAPAIAVVRETPPWLASSFQ